MDNYAFLTKPQSPQGYCEYMDPDERNTIYTYIIPPLLTYQFIASLVSMHFRPYHGVIEVEHCLYPGP